MDSTAARATPKLSLVEPGQPLAPDNTPRPRIVVNEARHSFGTRRVLDGVGLHVVPGEIYGLLGPNGAGKTTLMKAICGRLNLDSGSVRIDSKNPRTSRAARRNIGFVPQDIALYAYLTVRENLTVFARLAGLRRTAIKSAVDEVLERTGLAPRASQLCRSLSGGYQRRVNICASILHNPSVLVLDEPTVGIDVDAREAIHALLKGIAAQGTAILLTTHDLDQAQTLASRIGILKSGRFIAEGAPAGLLRDTFGTRKELTAIFGTPPDAAGAQRLNHMGFGTTLSPAAWSCLVSSANIDVAGLTRLLGLAGLPPKEIRVREPDLGSLFVKLVSEGAAS